MKLIFALATVTLAQAATLDRVYLPSNAQGSAGSSSILQTPYNSYGGNQAQNGYAGGEARPERPQAALERNAAILRQDYSNDGQTYAYSFETENGISADENGVATNGVQAQGGFAYTGDDGRVYSVRYTADVNGFLPHGDHLPTPPPIPEEILKALEQNARDEAAGIRDDGSYAEVKYGGNSEQFYNSNAQAVNNEYLPPSGQTNSQSSGY